jgi:hypothetical protein
LNIQKWLTPRFFLVLGERAVFSRLEVSADENKWKDHNQLDFGVHYRWSNAFSTALLGKSYYLSDKQSGFMNDIQTRSLSLAATFSSLRFSLPVGVGVKQDERFSQKDQGITYSLGFDLPHLRLGEYQNRFHASAAGDLFQDRKNSDLGFRYGVYRQFAPGTADSLNVMMNHLRRDYYISASGEIESREEQHRKVENVLRYGITRGFQFILESGFTSRTLRISSLTDTAKTLKRERRDFDAWGNFRLRVRRPRYRGELIFSLDSGEQKYSRDETSASSPFSGGGLLAAPDNESLTSILGFNAGWRFLPSDSLGFHVWIQRFRYDTPDADNFDDRDELRVTAEVENTHIFSPDLRMRLLLGFNLFHFVYIYGERSADNNWTRIFRVSPSVTWEPTHWLRFSQSVEVLANYVDYDYEYLFSGVKSFLYRKFQMTDSTQIRLTNRFSLRFLYRLELDENGKFLWDEWIEQKLVDRQSHTMTATVNWQPNAALSVSPGFTYYSRRGYRYSTTPRGEEEKELNLHFRSYGPTLVILYHGKRLKGTLSASSILTRTLNVEKKILTRVRLAVSWAL